MNKRLLGYAAGAGATALIGFAGLAVAETATSTTTGTDSFSTRLATKFGLKQEDVKAFMTADHAAQDAERTAAQEARLSAAVTAGTISAAQKTAITTKQAELKAAHEAKRAKLDAMTETERVAAREAHKATHDAMKADMDAWLKANGLENVDKSLLMGGGRGHGGGDRGDFGPGKN
jgi:hypothetical protein